MDLVVEQVDPGIALLTQQRPERLNALSWPLTDALHATLADIPKEDEARGGAYGVGRSTCSDLDLGGADALGAARSVQDAFRLKSAWPPWPPRCTASPSR